MKLDRRQRETYQRYAEMTLPRHTSYPAVPFWNTYGESEVFEVLDRSNRSGRGISLYIHVPFCESLCYYCSCTKEVLPKNKCHPWHGVTDRYVATLKRELQLVSDRVDRGRGVRQVHFGGGTPTYLTSSQIARVMNALRACFRLEVDAEIAVEVDPRVTSWDQLGSLRQMGFNRVSLGVQDFNPQVQAAVNRLQSADLVAEFVGTCRRLRFDSVSFDLIYGLPMQTPASVARTVRKTIAMCPDRVAFYRMAVIPELFRWQNVFKSNDLPASDETLEMFLGAVEAFERAGYRFIGLDHFAKPDDALSRACDEGTLRRSFQGMTTGAGLDVLGFGPSAISIFGDAFAQNAKSLAEWSEAIEGDRLATCRGKDLSREDLIRQAVLHQLYCDGEIVKEPIEARFGISFDRHFSDELKRLSECAQEGLVEISHKRIRLTNPFGRVLLRVVAAVFDTYLDRPFFSAGKRSLASRVG